MLELLLINLKKVQEIFTQKDTSNSVSDCQSNIYLTAL